MRRLVGYLRQYLVYELNIWYSLLVSAYLAVCIALNYRFDIEDTWIDADRRAITTWLKYILFYLVAIVPPLLAYRLFFKQVTFLKKPGFWLILVFGIAVYSFAGYFYQDWDWIGRTVEWPRNYFWQRCSDQLSNAMLVFIPITIYWWFSDRQQQPLYGFKLKNYPYGPYLVLLALMVPLVFFASTQKDFLETYPRIQHIVPIVKQSFHPDWLYYALFELCYGIDFIAAEFFFRGFMILALVRYAGSRIILPVAVFYCFIHFGKPMGEAVSSYFGGIILGTIAYYTRSIAGGVLIHLGIAWLMELLAAWAKYTWPV